MILIILMLFSKWPRATNVVLAGDPVPAGTVLVTPGVRFFTPTRNAPDFKHASQQQGTHKYMKVHEDIYVAIIPTLTIAVLPYNTMIYYPKLISNYFHHC